MALADWDPRLITPERALQLAGDWSVYVTVGFANLAQFEGDGLASADQWQINLRCNKCGGSAGMLGNVAASGLPGHKGLIRGTDTSMGDLLSGVLRHLVTAHDLSLSGAPS